MSIRGPSTFWQRLRWRFTFHRSQRRDFRLEGFKLFVYLGMPFVAVWLYHFPPFHNFIMNKYPPQHLNEQKMEERNDYQIERMRNYFDRMAQQKQQMMIQSNVNLTKDAESKQNEPN